MIPALALALLSAAAPLTLDEALAEAARANPDVALSRDSADLAGVDLYASYAGVLPRLDIGANFGHLWQGAQRTAPGLAFAGSPAIISPPIDSESYSLGATLTLPVFDGTRSWKAIDRARSASIGASRSLDETSLGVAFETTRRFFELVKAQESLRVLEETVARSQRIVSRAEALFEAGRGSRADVITAVGNLGNDRIAVEQQRARVAQAAADLAVILGRAADAPIEVAPPAGVTGPLLPTTDEPPPVGELLAVARRARPLLLAQGEAVRTAELDQAIARGEWWPVVSAQGTYNRSSAALCGTYGVYGDLANQYAATAQLVVSWNLFAGRQTLADQQRTAIGARRARTQASQSEQQVSNEIAHARSNVVALARAASLAAENLAAAQQGVALARERLEAGAANQLEVRDASLKLTQAQLSLVEARIDHVVARADLNRAVGGAL